MSKLTLHNTINLPLIEAAGGLVYDGKNNILLIYKRGKWDLPKGKVQQHDDDYLLTALREINEETGLKPAAMKATGKLVSTFHTTQQAKRPCLKKTHWYAICYSGCNEDTKPQFAEGIIECRWIHLSDVHQYLNNIRAHINYVINFWTKNLAYAPRD